ncbi:MAG: S-layer homology domain-containing protein [Oscillospiraceae bacterium]
MKKSLSLLLVLTLLVSMLTGFSLTAYAAGDDLAVSITSGAALEIYTQTGETGTPVLAKAYTADGLAALAETKADGYGYIFYKNDKANATVATEYVTLDTLLSDAGVTFGEGDKLAFTCNDGPYTKGDFSYENLSARGVDADGNAVPTAVAISWDNGSLADGTVAEIAAKAYNSGSLRFVSGMTEAEKEAQSAAGNRMPSGVVAITVVQSPALEIYTQAGETGTPALAKAYTADELTALAETKADGYGYAYYKGGAKAVAVTEYVTLDALLSDAGVTFAEGDKLAFTCNDGPYTKGDFSYENISARGVDADGNAVPTAVALTWNDGNLADGTVADIAATAYNSGSLRFVSGMTEAEKEGQSAAGNRMPSGVVAITVVQSPALEIYTQAGETGTPTLAKAYTADELAALAETKTDGYGYVFYKNDTANATVATEYVPLDALLSDAGVTFGKGDKLAFTCNDGPYTKGDFSYENISARGVDADGNAVPTAVAISWDNGSLADGTVAEIAAKAYNSGSLRFVSGMTEAEKEAQSAAGNRMPSGVVAITVVSRFSDVEAGSYYEEAVVWAVQTGVTTGITDTTFGPAADCTRKQVVTFLWRAAGSPEPTTKENPFTDVKEDAYYKAILWAAENGITTGNGSGGFDPDGLVTRRDFVTFLYRFAKAEPVKDAAPFTDVPAGQYYSDAVAWAAANAITSGTGNNKFSPEKTCIRAEVVTFLYRYFK